MDKKIAWLLIGCVGVLFIIILVVGVFGGGLSKQVKAQAQAELKNLEDASKQLAQDRTEIEQALSSQATLFEADQAAPNAPWKERLDAADAKMKKASAAGDKLTELLEKNDADDAAKVEETIEQVQSNRLAAVNDVSVMRDRARELLEFQKKLKSKIPQLSADYAAIEKYNIEPLQEIVDKAIVDWPAKKAELSGRLDFYTSGIEKAKLLWTGSQAARKRAEDGEATGADVVALLTVVTRYRALLDALKAAEKELPTLIAQLYWVWDKVLVDMEVQEGEVVSFRQKFQVNRHRVVIVPEGKEAEEGPKAESKSDEAEWEVATKANYDKMKKYLGMSVLHKPAGKFDHEAASLVQPPGYAYMCPVQQQRNHYGYWHRHRTGYFYWMFYPRYYGMRDRLWGRSYSPVTSQMYGDYDLHRQSGRTYYGRDNMGRSLYGSTGSATKQQYSKSRYVSTNGFSNTQYVKSGGTYRGSRYATRTSSTRSGSYRSSSYSRSSGGRSSFGGK